jgi:hypothetical protein
MMYGLNFIYTKTTTKNKTQYIVFQFFSKESIGFSKMDIFLDKKNVQNPKGQGFYGKFSKCDHKFFLW